MKLIDADGLNEFAKQDASWRILPWLIRRLLSAEPGLEGLHLPTGIWRPGWDGTVANAAGSPFVPRGASAWELSNHKQIAANASANLAKRTTRPGSIDPADTTFVYVTMRHWTGKDTWLAEANAGGRWRGVCALDSEDLVGWLEMHPDLHQWTTRTIASLSRGEGVVETDLPADVQGFVGRGAEIDSIEKLMTDASGPRTVVVWGPPGAGKTALTVHAAHRLAGHFPGGQIFLDAAASSTSSDDSATSQRAAGALLRQVLARLGFETPAGRLKGFKEIDTDALPNDPHELAAIYRSELRERACLLVIDGIDAESQIRLLDPGHSTSLLLVSSRSRLGGLDAALRIEAVRLTATEGEQLLAHELGRPVAAPEEPDAARVVRLCDGLPLALRIAGRMAARHPQWRLGHLARRLQEEQGRLGRLKVGDLAVRSSFSSAYASLPTTHQRVFRRACIIHGPTFTLDLLHTVTPDQDRDDVSDVLDDLIDHALLNPTTRGGHYRAHDLLRLFGRERFADEEDDESRPDVMRRLGRWLRGGLDQTTGTVWPELASVGHALQTTPDRIGASLEWLDDHFENLLGLAEALRNGGDHNHTIDLILRVADYCEIRNRWDDLDALAQMATSSIQAIHAKGTANPEVMPFIETVVTTMRAKSAWGLRDFPQALSLAEDAIAAAPDPVCLAYAHLVRGGVLRAMYRGTEALADYQRAKTLLLDAGDNPGLEMALHNIGALLTELGQPVRALPYLKSDLKACIARGDRVGQAHTVNSIALAHIRLGELDEAERLLKEAAELCLECHDLARAGNALNDLGLVLNAKNDYAAAYHCHLQDLIFCRILNDERGAQRAGIRVAHNMIGINPGYAPQAIKLVADCTGYASEQNDRELLAAAGAVHAEIGYVIGDYDRADSVYDASARTYLDLQQGQAALTTRLRQLQQATPVGRVRPVEQALRAMAESSLFTDDPISEQQLYLGLAAAYRALGDKQGAARAAARADAIDTPHS